MMGRDAAAALRTIAEDLGKALEQKSLAYGSAHNRQLALWQLLLEGYRTDDGSYLLPAAMIAHMPRLTRIFDRILRIIAHPEVDPMGEDPWRDLAGDAIAGIQMPKGTQCREPGCDRPDGHHGVHASFDARGLTRWVGRKGAVGEKLDKIRADMAADPNPRGYDEAGEQAECPVSWDTIVGVRYCALPPGHAGDHVCSRGTRPA